MNSPLYNHQSNAIERAIKEGSSFAFFHDPGTGKTRTCLDLFKHYRKAEPDLKLLVICPLSLINAAWGNDIEKFTSFSYSPFKTLRGDIPDIIGVNYEYFISKKRLPQIVELARNYKFMCVLDESCRLQNFKSLTTKTLLSVKDYFKYKIVCTGTPFSNSELELWGQLRFINDVFPKSFFAFRNTWFHLERNGQVYKGQSAQNKGVMKILMSSGWKYAITEKKREALIASIAHCTDWVKKKDALDLPDKITEIRDVFLSPAERKAYKDMKKHLIAEIKGNPITAQVALAKYMKLRQATSGFMYNENGETCHIGNSKLNELKNTLTELGNQQVIIWVQFHAEETAIKQLLEKKSYTYLTANQKHKDDAVNLFKNNKVQYMIAHAKSAGHGLTFTNCSTAIFYGLDYSYKSHIQAKDRIHRIGQKNKCLYIYLLANNTIDHDILKVLEGKQSLQDIIEGLVLREAA